jgi:hypothetical protein
VVLAGSAPAKPVLPRRGFGPWVPSIAAALLKANMNPEVILLLEDNDERIAAFRAVVSQMEPGIELHQWSDAHASDP